MAGQEEKRKSGKLHPNVTAKIVPHSNEAEQGLLCCMMISEVALEKVMAAGLKPSMFYSAANRNVYAAMEKMYAKNVPVDFATVVEELDTQGTLKDSGGPEYISIISTLLGNSANYSAYIDIIRKDARLRSLMEASNEVLEKCYSGDEDDKALIRAEELITKIAEDEGMSAMVPFSKAVEEAGLEIEKANRGQMPLGLMTGFYELDRKLGGIGEGDLVIIGARPGQGKTSLGMNIALNVALQKDAESGKKKVVAVFSLEMPRKQLAKRMISSLAKVDFSKMTKGQLGDDKVSWRDIMDAETLISDSLLFIDDTSSITPVEILSKCRRLKREQGRLDLVVIDYLALMQTGKKTENRQQEVADMSRNIKLAAKDLKVPILLLSQLNREAESGKGGKEPKMSNLRESGAIEQDADIILFIYRPDETDPSVKFKDKVDIIIAKHRNGECGRIPLKWVPEHVSFEDAPEEYHETDKGARQGDASLQQSSTTEIRPGE